MKKLLIIAAVLICNNFSYSQWYQQISNTPNTLKSIFFINKTTGWACGFETVLKTTDCGNTWTASFLQGYHRSVFFINENTGWICGESGRLYKTINGGSDWYPVNSNVSVFLNYIVFTDQNTGIVTGNNKIILKTTDSGISWFSVNKNNALLDFHSAKILDKDNYIVTGTESAIYTTSDAGASWDTMSLGMPNPLLTVEFTDHNTGWVSGCCGMFMKTINGGLNWSPEVYLTPGFSVYSMKFIDDQIGWVAGDAGYILRTTNGGHNWDSLNSLTHTGLYSIFFLNKDTGFVAGYNGLILKTTNGGGEGYPLNVVQLSNEMPEKFFLYQNYPNPFNPETVIRYSITESGFVVLKVYDVSGKVIQTLLNERQVAGTYSVKFEGNDLPNGVYFYELNTGIESVTKKMLLIK